MRNSGRAKKKPELREILDNFPKSVDLEISRSRSQSIRNFQKIHQILQKMDRKKGKLVRCLKNNHTLRSSSNFRFE